MELCSNDEGKGWTEDLVDSSHERSKTCSRDNSPVRSELENFSQCFAFSGCFGLLLRIRRQRRRRGRRENREKAFAVAIHRAQRGFKRNFFWVVRQARRSDPIFSSWARQLGFSRVHSLWVVSLSLSCSEDSLKHRLTRGFSPDPHASSLRALLSTALSKPTLCSIDEHRLELVDDFHISFSRTFVLRYHWIEAFRNSLQDKLKDCPK